MLIDIGEKTFEFIKKLVYEIDTQDNRATALPILYTIMETRREYGIDSDYGVKGHVWIKDGVEWEPTEVIEKYAVGNYLTDDDIKGLGFHKCYYRYTESLHPNFFFTEEACKKYIKNNKHNLSSPVDYVIHAYRNHEIEDLITSLKEIVRNRERLESPLFNVYQPIPSPFSHKPLNPPKEE